MKHTPGPWKIKRLDNGLRFEIHNPEIDYWIAQVQNPKPVHGQANARLIAAAPDLLKSLEEAVVYLRACEHYQRYDASPDDAGPLADQAEAAIASAKGTS